MCPWEEYLADVLSRLPEYDVAEHKNVVGCIKHCYEWVAVMPN